jgi:hypothetical protein
MNLKQLNIDYALLGQAKEFYSDQGYTYVEVPWIVDEKLSYSTHKDEAGKFILDDYRHLVGSGEQAFIGMAQAEELLPYKKYMTITPCFRKGENDETHAEEFMKLELFMYSTQIFDDSNDLEAVTKRFRADIPERGFRYDAFDCFKELGVMEYNLYTTVTEDNDPLEIHDDPTFLNTIKNVDIEFKTRTRGMLELGSYGYRRGFRPKMGGNLYQEFHYGTGIALPRFQLTRDKYF